MGNAPLLRFLAAVQDHAATGKSLMACSGYDALELQVAIQTAQLAGYAEPTGKGTPLLRLTAEGRAWATAQLAPFASLMAEMATRRAA